MVNNLYNSNYDAWVAEQIRHLKFKALEKLDIDHLISELEGIGKSDRRSLESNLRILLAYLLKWKYQPEETFPNDCLFSIDEILDSEFLPEN